MKTVVSVSLQEQLDVNSFIDMVSKYGLACYDFAENNGILSVRIDRDDDYRELLSFIKSNILYNFKDKRKSFTFKWLSGCYTARLFEKDMLCFIPQVTECKPPVYISLDSLTDSSQLYDCFTFVMNQLLIWQFKLCPQQEYNNYPGHDITSKDLIRDTFVDDGIVLSNFKYSKLTETYCLTNESASVAYEGIAKTVMTGLDLINFENNKALGTPSSQWRFVWYSTQKRVYVYSRKIDSFSKMKKVEELLWAGSGEEGRAFREWIVYLLFKYKRFIEFRGLDDKERYKEWKILLRGE